MKRKVNIDRPEISSEEISKRKNFDSVFKNHASVSAKPLLKKSWFLSSMIIAIVAVITTILVLNNKPATINEELSTTVEQLTTSDITLLEAFYKSEESKPCINPPLVSCNVPYTTYKINAEKGATLDFKTGSKIIIPKNTFADESGKPIKGEIELRYREFHDAVDFFVSGIPMTYDSAGVRYQFESAGMMEILAYQNGKQVNMASGKSVNVELASNYKGTEYNLYELDTLKNNWSCLGKDKVVYHGEENKTAVAKKKDEIIIVQETPEYKTIETKKTEVQKEKEIKIIALPKLPTSPKKPDLAKKGKYTFNIDVDQQEYPELAIYKGLLFEVGDENKTFDKSMYDIIWDEAIIKDGTMKGKNYSLTLKKAAKRYDIIVYPVFEGKDYEAAMKDYQNKFTEYNVVFEKRKADEKRIEEEYQAKIALLKQQQEKLEREWAEAEKNRYKALDTEQKVSRMFAINRFGVYNCDNPSVYPKGVTCTAKLSNEKGVKLMCYDVYLVDKKENALFSYTKNPIPKFSFNPKSINMLWAVDNGVLYWLKPEQFISISGTEGVNNLKLNRVDQKFTTADEMKTYFNF